MKAILIFAVFVAVILLMNSCSCPLWFNNGCPFEESTLGKFVNSKIH